MSADIDAIVKGGCGCLAIVVVVGLLCVALGGHFHIDIIGAAIIFIIGGGIGLAFLAAYNKGRRDASPTFSVTWPAPKPPDLIAINHDKHYAEHIGRTSDGRYQFFLTYPFVPPTTNDPGCEFLARYLFDIEGQLVEATIDKLGPRSEYNHDKAVQLFHQRLKELGKVVFCRITIAPFFVHRFNTDFGLIPHKSLDDDQWWVELHPGNYMAFHEPWDSGEYDS